MQHHGVGEFWREQQDEHAQVYVALGRAAAPAPVAALYLHVLVLKSPFVRKKLQPRRQQSLGFEAQEMLDAFLKSCLCVGRGYVDAGRHFDVQRLLG